MIGLPPFDIVGLDGGVGEIGQLITVAARRDEPEAGATAITGLDRVARGLDRKPRGAPGLAGQRRRRFVDDRDHRLGVGARVP
ncbi:MAG: hypothetical protein EA356_14345 [Geminicoccaceae bacterium]|nr:MAG: hypothetical protein EA356_14345 [Geminicoccaceae bacterium]